MSDLARQRIAQAKATRATTLDLGRCGLDHWPEELWELTWLESLTLSNQWWDAEKREWIESQNHGPYNLLHEIPAAVARLTALKQLRCGGSGDVMYIFGMLEVPIDEWGISDLSVLRGLSQLKSLSLSYTNVSDISVLQGLSQLKSLDLSYTNVSDISVLQGLSQLKSLSLSHSRVKGISVLKGLSNLQALDLSWAQIKDISVLKGLGNLQVLSLSDINMSDISVLQGLCNLQSLSLSGSQISDISVLQGLCNLQSLDLSGYQISDISVLQGLSQLKSLSLSHSRVKGISVLKGLSNLQALDLSGYQIKDISVLQGLSNLKLLDLSHTNVSDISVLQGLRKLKLLDLSHTNVSDISVLQDLDNLKSLSLSGSKIKDISILKGLSKLKSLDLSETKLSDISVLKGLSNLQALYLSDTNVSDISVLQGLRKLESLSLSETNMSDISVLQDLSKLKSLDLSWAQIKDISVLKGLGNLQALSLSYTNMSDISALQGLSNLQALSLSYTNMSDISALQDLSNLQALDLSNTNMSNILALQGLSKLQVLDLSDTQVSDISALQGLSKLQSLDLSDTQVSDLSALQDLRELRALSLSNTQVSTIEAWLIELPQLRELNLSGSPIRHLPYEIINQSRSNCLQDLKNWFHDLAAGSVRNKEIKVMFVGNGRVGKSCILERITVGTYTRNKLSTHAIELKTWPVEDRDSDGMILNLWDFGGQDIYLGTHRIFMQSRALYLLIWDWEAESQQHRAAEEPDAEGYVHKNQPLLHWMDYIRSLSKQSPVMVVQNKVDIHKNKQAPARQVMDKNGWVLDYFAVSAETGRGISDLKQGILEAARSMPEWGMQIPASWQKVRTAIRERTTQEKDISQDAFEAICAQAEVRKISQASLLRYLHDTGVLFYQKGLFHNRIILDQQWAIEAVYTLFRRDKMFWHLLHRGDGQFSFEELDLFWRGEKGFDTEQSKVALSFMLSCEICFQLNPKQSNDKNKAVYVAPQLLPEQRPDKVHTFWQNLSGGLTLRFDYEYLHEAFVHRFIVRAGHLAQPHHLWRRGIWFIWEQTSALIFAREHGEAESAGGFIQIQVRGPRQAELLHLIRKEFENIHPAEINHSTKIVLDAGTLLDFSELKKYRQNQLSEILAPDGSSVDPKAFDDFFFDPEKIAAHSHKTAVEKEKSMRDLQPSPPLLPDQKQAWKVRVGDGKGVEVLKELMSFSDDNQVYLFHARYERLKKQTHDGTRNAEGLNQEENSLIAAILELINQIEILP